MRENVNLSLLDESWAHQKILTEIFNLFLMAPVFTFQLAFCSHITSVGLLRIPMAAQFQSLSYVVHVQQIYNFVDCDNSHSLT